MAIELISTNQVATYAVQDGDTVTLLPGVVMTTAAGDPVFEADPGGDNSIDDTRITVMGTIITEDMSHDFFFSTTTAHDNLFTISSTGVINAANDAVAFRTGNNNTILNYGEVVSGDYAFYFRNGENNRVENHGLLTTTPGTTEHVAIAMNWVSSSASDYGSIVNTGTISGTHGASLDFALVGSRSSVDILNSGIITTPSEFAVLTSVYADTLTNSGEITGNVTMEAGTDTLTNSGVINGKVTLDDNNDTYRGVGQGTVSEGVFGGNGEDTLIGSDARDKLFGESGNDNLNGNSGADDLFGAGNDDTLRGGAGDDFINGGTGVDFILGGSGDDEIIGGTGRDIMRGNGGQDAFVFQSVADSLTTAGNTDVIIGFERGVDVIDLDGLAAGDLSFIGTGAFTGVGDELRAVVLANGTMSVQVDTDGDTVADFRLYLRNIDTVDAGDFIL
ncbi:MAG: calcium-binding protein [Rhodobacter sp.]|nr:calcium-binding protein [Rhodobacter sp.]